jgi:hypothetical protein
MPRSRNEPYDAYTTISFFPDDSPTATTDDDPAVKDRALDSIAPNAVASPAPGAHSSGAFIVPLLVTDSLESSLQYRQRQSITQLAAAIQYFRTEVGTLGNFKFQDAALEQALGNDLNSLLSVARVSDNTLRVRMGAMQQGSTRHAMVPRNHNVTVLVMVPSGSTGCMTALAKTTLVDTLTGDELPDAAEQTHVDAFAGLRARYELGESVRDDVLREMLAHAKANSSERFIEILDQKVAPSQRRIHGYWQALWVDLVSLGLRSPYAATSFELPGMSPCGGTGHEDPYDASGDAQATAWSPISFEEQSHVTALVTGSPPNASWTIALAPSTEIDPATVTTRIVALRGSQVIADMTGSPRFDADKKKLVLSFPAIASEKITNDVTLQLELSIAGRKKTWNVSLPD